MGDAVGGMLASAVGIAISPMPLIAVILMLATPRGRSNGTAFAAGWVVALAAVVTVVVSAGSGLSAGSDRPSWAWWLKLALGTLFLLLGFRQWRARPREGHVHGPPAWMEAVDRFTPVKAAGLAAALVALNPKNLVLAVGGAVSIATATASGAGKACAAALMVLIGSLCTLVPLGVYLFGGDRAARILGEWKAWMAAHNAAIMTVLLVVLGATYVGDALTGLTS
ncbi:GAP family protein [Kitasatospora sp. NPDC058201]|uniref:GAP family protein n=1 Tax=Streptomycetaceae TaxID=2062 RepID=UPI002E76348B|nr:GAP family protein [Streptomyces sp. BE303]MED7953144.1 GAP family protein [Streptomyces sp. BE303]